MIPQLIHSVSNMSTPFDDVIASIAEAGYHNHRLEGHSDIVSDGIYNDLVAHCEAVGTDDLDGTIKKWLNVHAPGARGRKIDLFVRTTGGRVSVARHQTTSGLR